MYVIKHVNKGYYIGDGKYSKDNINDAFVVCSPRCGMLEAGEEFVEVKVVKTLVEV